MDGPNEMRTTMKLQLTAEDQKRLARIPDARWIREKTQAMTEAAHFAMWRHELWGSKGEPI